MQWRNGFRERPGHFDEFYLQVAIFDFLFCVGLALSIGLQQLSLAIKVIEEGCRQPVIAGLQSQPMLVQLGVSATSADLNGLEIMPVGPQSHLHLFIPRLITVGLNLEHIVARHRGFVLHEHLTLGGKRCQGATTNVSLDLRRSKPSSLRGQGAGDNRPIQNRLSCVEVLLEQDWWHGQHVPDVVKTIPHIVLREVVGRLEIDPEQVANRVVVFHPIQSPQSHTSGIRTGGIDRKECSLNPTDQMGSDLRIGLGLLLLGRHFSRTHRLDDTFPSSPIAQDRHQIGV